MSFFRTGSKAPPLMTSSEDESTSSEQGIEETVKNEDFDLDIRKITLQLGDITATFMPDGSWLYSSDHDQGKEKRLKLKNKQAKLTDENTKLQQKFDILFEMAQKETKKYAELETELKQLRTILHKSPLCHSTQK